jgi:hypothetical protein
MFFPLPPRFLVKKRTWECDIGFHLVKAEKCIFYITQLQAALEGKDDGAASKAAVASQPQAKFKNFDWKFRVIAPTSNYSLLVKALDWGNQTFCVSSPFFLFLETLE